MRDATRDVAIYLQHIHKGHKERHDHCGIFTNFKVQIVYISMALSQKPFT